MSIVLTKIYELEDINNKEVLRYAGVNGEAIDLCELVDECIKEANGKFVYKVCYSEFDIAFYEDYIDLGFLKTTSQDLRKNLTDCSSVVVFAATVGLEIDRLIKKYSHISPAKALIFQAIGAERIEALCDTFNSDIKAEKTSVAPRFSAGYGDFALGSQKEIFKVLDCERKIGLTLNGSMLMSPSKSVTAIIGVKK